MTISSPRPDTGRHLLRDTGGATLIEFALLFPTFIILLMGGFDLAHTQYTRAVLLGQMQKAARDSALDANNSITAQNALDESVRAAVIKVAASAQLTFVRQAYYTYRLAQSKAEPFIDTNANNDCDDGESYEDANRNGTWDVDAGKVGQGGGKDVVIYTVTVRYDRLFPMPSLSGWSHEVVLTSTTLLRNQPFEKQAVPIVRRCT